MYRRVSKPRPWSLQLSRLPEPQNFIPFKSFFFLPFFSNERKEKDKLMCEVLHFKLFSRGESSRSRVLGVNPSLYSASLIKITTQSEWLEHRMHF